MTKAPAAQVSMIAYLWPVFIVLFAAFLPGGKLRADHIIGGAFALSGCWILLSNNDSSFSSESLIGYILAFSCALIWALYSVTNRLLNDVSSESVGWFCGATALLATICHFHWEQTVWSFSSIQWIGIWGLGIGPVGLAFLAWDHGVKHGDLPLLGVLAYAAPLVSIVLLIVAGEAKADGSIAFASIVITLGSLIASGHLPLGKLSRL